MEDYSRRILKIVVAQICQTIGWHSVNVTPLEFMVDLLHEYFQQMTHFSHQYAEVLGRTDINLDDLGLAFQLMNVNIAELAEYVKNVESVPCALKIPKLPITHEDHLNFLKPGSKEVVTRQAHIHDHFPPINVDDGDDSATDKNGGLIADDVNQMGQSRLCENGDSQVNPSQLSPEMVFKRPSDPLCENVSINKRAKVIDDGRPLREIHSVMMTTSGFLSPAREGKLPESRTPAVPQRSISPPLIVDNVPVVETPAPAPAPPITTTPRAERKVKKSVKKAATDENKKVDKENKKKNREKDSAKGDAVNNENKISKKGGLKDMSSKTRAAIKADAINLNSTGPTISANNAAIQGVGNVKDDANNVKSCKNSSPKRKFIMFHGDAFSQDCDNNVGKLPVEPDKQKINILKKISKPREDKIVNNEHAIDSKIKNTKEINLGTSGGHDGADKSAYNDKDSEEDNKSMPQTPEVQLLGDVESVELQSPSSDVYIFDDISPPGTPSTPKTPEMNVSGCGDQKRKRKERSNRKKDNLKQLSARDNAKTKSVQEIEHHDIVERPKTPQAADNLPPKDPNIPVLPFPFFPPFPPTPGLIPHPIGHPMFPRFPIPPRELTNPQYVNQNFPIPPPVPLTEVMNDFPVQKTKSNMKVVPICEPNPPPPVVEYPNNIGGGAGAGDQTNKNNRLADDQHQQHQQPSVKKIVEAVNLPQPDVVITKTVNNVPVSDKVKVDRLEKKSKKHKIEKKDKIKKKKERKEKHREKLDKLKEKKEKAIKIKEKKERRDKKKDKQSKVVEALPKITFKLGTGTSNKPTTVNPPMKKITIKPIPKKLEENMRRESSPELAKISALITRPPKQKNCKVKAEQPPKKVEGNKDERDNNTKERHDVVSTVVDQSGHQVWICPACGNQDDGSPMIGCDDCDAWYHWVCVGMQVPPATNEDWYCRLCIAKQQEMHHDRKKKKRKKKVKVAT